MSSCNVVYNALDKHTYKLYTQTNSTPLSDQNSRYRNVRFVEICTEVKQPETQYALSGDVHIAYQVLGAGPIDIVFVPGFLSHLEFQWEEPMQAHFFHRLASFSRLIRFDKRGVGLSDLVRNENLDERMDDIRAVMDAAGSRQAVILGLAEGGPLSIMFAATYPERTCSLILLNTFARFLRTPDYTEGIGIEVVQQVIRETKEKWGTGAFASSFVPSAAGNESFRSWWTRFERMALSPGAALERMQWVMQIDARHVLSAIQVPALVIHSTGDSIIPTAHGKFIAKHIEGSRYIEIEGIDHFPWPAGDAVADEVEEFITGARHVPEVDRVLATVLFTDIVGSTELASRLGDHVWHDLLELHNTIIRKELKRFRGCEVDTSGDGFFATFDGPGRALRCACSIRDSVQQLGIDIRVGLHTGEVEMIDDKASGIAVHIGARVAAAAQAREVLTSGTTKDLVIGSGLSFKDRGEHILKGVPGEWRLFSVEQL